MPIPTTGDGRHIGLTIAWHFLNQKQPVTVSYRTCYPAVDGPREAGAICIPADSSTDEGVPIFADEVRTQTDGLRTIMHNAGVWAAGEPDTPLNEILSCMIRIHINTPCLPNHMLEELLHGHGHIASDIIHFTDYVVEHGSDKHIAYATSKAALDSMAHSFARKLVPEVKVNTITPPSILFNEGDDAEYRQQALNKSLMKIASGRKEVTGLINYLLTSYFITGRSFTLDNGRHLR